MSTISKAIHQSSIINSAARACAKRRRVTFQIRENDEETKDEIPERESKYSDTESENSYSYSDWDEYGQKNLSRPELIRYNALNEKINSLGTPIDPPNESEMENDDDPTSDYQPSSESEMESDDDPTSDYQPSSESEMENDDDPTSDYQPSSESEAEDEEENFDAKVFDILSSLKYKVKTPNKYLFDWGAEYWDMLECMNALKKYNKDVPIFKRKIKSSKNWDKIINEVRTNVLMERLV